MYNDIDEHGEREPPTAEEWEMIIALARKSVSRDPNSIPDADPGEGPDRRRPRQGRGILLMSPFRVCSG